MRKDNSSVADAVKPWEAGAGIEGFVRSQLPPPPASVLEAGCGSEELALSLSVGGWRVTAVDPEAPEGGPFVRGAGEELDLEDHGPFDAADAVLPLHHAGRKVAEGNQPDGAAFDSWYARTTDRRAAVHGEGEVLASLEKRFATRSLSYGPYLFRQGLDVAVEPLERKLIAEGGIQATSLRWVGVLEAGSQVRDL